MLASLRPRDYERSRTISSKVFVGNLAFQSTKEELQELLSAAGTIRDVYLPSDRATGRPRGFAFVEFTTDQEAQAAIEQFNNTCNCDRDKVAIED